MNTRYENTNDYDESTYTDFYPNTVRLTTLEKHSILCDYIRENDPTFDYTKKRMVDSILEHTCPIEKYFDEFVYTEKSKGFGERDLFILLSKCLCHPSKYFNDEHKMFSISCFFMLPDLCQYYDGEYWVSGPLNLVMKAIVRKISSVVFKSFESAIIRTCKENKFDIFSCDNGIIKMLHQYLEILVKLDLKTFCVDQKDDNKLYNEISLLFHQIKEHISSSVRETFQKEVIETIKSILIENNNYVDISLKIKMCKDNEFKQTFFQLLKRNDKTYLSPYVFDRNIIIPEHKSSIISDYRDSDDFIGFYQELYDTNNEYDTYELNEKDCKNQFLTSYLPPEIYLSESEIYNNIYGVEQEICVRGKRGVEIYIKFDHVHKIMKIENKDLGNKILKSIRTTLCKDKEYLYFNDSNFMEQNKNSTHHKSLYLTYHGFLILCCKFSDLISESFYLWVLYVCSQIRFGDISSYVSKKQVNEVKEIVEKKTPQNDLKNLLKNAPIK